MPRFVISWRNSAYRVSLPCFLSEGEQLEVVDARSYDRLKQALEDIHGSFIPGRRVTYSSPDDTLDHIREIAGRALGKE
jgi:hypothetical protein